MTDEEVTRSEQDAFEWFFDAVEPKLRRALIAGYGAEIGREATADALLYAWQNWNRVSAMENPEGYLYRVGQSKARRHRYLPRLRHTPTKPSELPWVEPGLAEALRGLTTRQRQCVLLLYAMDLTRGEVASLLGIRPSSVRTHSDRALQKLRSALKVTNEPQERPT